MTEHIYSCSQFCTLPACVSGRARDAEKAIRLALEACNRATEDWDRNVTETQLLALCNSATMRDILDELERLRAVAVTAQAYYTRYCQDEAEDAAGWNERTSICSLEQAERAAELRDALAAMAQEVKHG